MSSLSRRRFMQTGAALFAAPYIVPSSCFGANERIAVGCVGVKNQGSGNLKRFMSAGCEVVAICDVDSDVRNAAAKVASEKGMTPELYGDYRKMLEQKNIDAVVCTTPDHWHALITIHSCQAGKDVYCEKPLSLTIAEGRRMVNAARENQRIVQTGSQQRSATEFWKACTLVRNGAIGELQTILVGIPTPNHPGKVTEGQPPANLDYDLWLGPAPYVPYAEKRVHYNFRFWWDYSGGQMTNFGAHHLDIAQWGMGTDDSGPASIEGTATFHPQMVHEVTESCRITYEYASGVKVILGQAQKDIPQGATFIGSKGQIYVNRGKLTSDPKEILETKVEDLAVQLYRSTDHTKNFLECMQTRRLPICDVEIGHRSATVCHLGNLAVRLGRKIQWDPQKEQVMGDAEAQSMTDKTYREPWSHNMKLARR